MITVDLEEGLLQQQLEEAHDKYSGEYGHWE